MRELLLSITHSNCCGMIKHRRHSIITSKTLISPPKPECKRYVRTCRKQLIRKCIFYWKEIQTLIDVLTVGLTKSEFNLCAGGIFNLIPSLGGRLCVRRCVYRCGGSICLAGDRGYFRSSGKYVVILTKPVIKRSFDCNGIRILGS